MYTIDSLKQQHTTFTAAKAFHNLKAKSWVSLAEKLNQPDLKQLQAQIAQLKAENAALKAQLASTQEFDPIGFWLDDNNFDRSKFSDFKTPKEATKKESVARQFYKELARRYHPDKGGTSQQMANLKKLEGQMLALVEMNGGLGK
jgi:ribosomal protein L29